MRLVLNLVADDDCIMSNGRMLHFHSFSPATEYALLQYVLRVAMGSSSNWLLQSMLYCNTFWEWPWVHQATGCLRILIHSRSSYISVGLWCSHNCRYQTIIFDPCKSVTLFWKIYLYLTGIHCRHVSIGVICSYFLLDAVTKQAAEFR